MKIIELPLKEIREDFFFCFTTQIENPRLYESIFKSGVRTPIQVTPSNGGYRLISGFKRVAISRKLGSSSLPAEIINESTISETFINVLHEQTALYPLTLVEKARAIGICEVLKMNHEKIVQEILPVLELPVRQDLFSRLKNIREFPIYTQEYFEQYDVSLKKIGMFFSLSLDEQALMVRMANQLQLRHIELSEIINFISEIGKRESIPFQQVYNALNLDVIIQESELSRNEKIDRLKIILKERRYPQLSQWRQSLEKTRKSMQLPLCVRLYWDVNLEAPGVVLQANLQSNENVKAIANFISDKKNQNIIGEMFAII